MGEAALNPAEQKTTRPLAAEKRNLGERRGLTEVMDWREVEAAAMRGWWTRFIGKTGY